MSGVPADTGSPPAPGNRVRVFPRALAAVVAAWFACAGATPRVRAAAEAPPQSRDTLVYKNGDRITGSVVSASPEVIVFASERFGELRAKPEEVVVIPGVKAPEAAAPAATAKPAALATAEAANQVAAARADAERVSVWDRFSPSVLTARVRNLFGPWNGRFSFSIEEVSDIAERENLSFESSLRRKWTRNELQLSGRFDYAETDGVRTTDLVKASGSWRHEFTKNYFAQYRPSGEWNRASKRQGVPNDYVLLQQELGIGYHVFTSATRKLRLGVSQNRFDIWNTAPTPEHDSRSVQSLFEEIELKLPWRIGITQRGVWYPVGDARDGWENRIEVNKKLTETLSTALRHEMRRRNPDGSAQDYSKTKLLLAFDF